MVKIDDIINISRNLSVLSTYSDRFYLCDKNDHVASFDLNFDVKKASLSESFNKLYQEIFESNFSVNISDVDFNDIALTIIIDKICKIKDYIIFDDILTYLSLNQKKLILKYLKDNNINVINFTSDSNELLIYPYIVVLDNKEIILKGNVMDVLCNEYKLKTLGYELPFIVDLSLQLKSYDLIDDVYFNEKKLRDELWN